jgi:hypothetical protein
MTAYETLLRAFSILNKEEIENLRCHLKRETPVLCGPEVKIYFTKYNVG